MAQIQVVSHYGALLVQILDSDTIDQIRANYRAYADRSFDGTILLQGDDRQWFYDLFTDEDLGDILNVDAWDLVQMAGYSDK